jgi:glycosyltransferase involved in cell wall biosynthesis
MNVLLLTIAPKKSQKMIRDIANEFVNDGHLVFMVCPADIENLARTKFVLIDGIRYLFVHSGNTVGKINILKKGWNFIMTDPRYQKALQMAVDGIDIDLILYSTPPITLANTIVWAKKKFNARTYLMLKDIFPQNAIDMGMMKKNGVMGLAWRYFRKKEKKLYNNSDYIGCMSPANCKYVLEHNSEINKQKVGICVNSYVEEPVRQVDQRAVRDKYQIPQDKMIFLYGGNLGKPQGLKYFVDVMKSNKDKDDRFFLICGGGNDQNTILKFIEEEQPANVKYMASISPDDFDDLSRACDVGLVFLDSRFTIPNFPSRMLSIMLNEKPILAATDSNTDVGEVIQAGNMGWWCESTDTIPFNQFLDDICASPNVVREKGKNARKYYETHYTSRIAYQQILEGLRKVSE